MQRYAPAMLSRVEAFAAQGVTLQDPLLSWSGIREADGSIVIAMSEADVRASADGFRCLLWTPVLDSGKRRMDGAGNEERLRHCRLAAVRGGADGLLVSCGCADVEAGAVLALHVEKRRNQFWATWGSTVRKTWLAAAPRRGLAVAV